MDNEKGNSEKNEFDLGFSMNNHWARSNLLLMGELEYDTARGPYFLSDDFYDQADASFWGPAWFMDYDQLVWNTRLQLYHRQTGFIAVDSFDKFLWHSRTGVRVPLFAGLVGSVECEIDYDSEPAVEAENTEQTFKLKLVYTW